MREETPVLGLQVVVRPDRTAPGVGEEVLRLHDSQSTVYWDDGNQADLNRERGTPLRLRSQRTSQAERK